MKDKLDTIRPQRQNANRHTPRGMGALEDSIQKDGWIGAITVAADGEAFDGSARVEVGVTKGFEDAIVVRSKGDKPIVHIREDIPTADHPRAVRLGIAANRVAELNLGWDTDILADLRDNTDVLAGLFSDDELDTLLATITRTEGDGGDDFDTTPQDGPTRVQRGEVWRIGEHRLMCGDSTVEGDVARLMGAERAQLLLTSPPYGVGMDYEGAPDERATVQLLTDVFSLWCAGVLPNGFAFVNFGERYIWSRPMVAVYFDIFKASGWRWYDQRFWKRSQVGMAIWNTTQPRALSQVEYLFTFQNGKANYPVHDLDISKEQLWDDGGSSAGMGHPAVMAVGVAEKAATIYTNRNDIIAEPFAGSGTTLIAAQRTGRRCYGMEIEPRYCDVILRRAEAEGIGPIEKVSG